MSTTGALKNRTAFHSIQSSGAIANIDYQPVINQAEQLVKWRDSQ
jgi:hypothetical protein